MAAADNEFTDLSHRWLDGTMRLNPVNATQTGDHRFDSDLDDLSADGRAKSEAFSQADPRRTRHIDGSKLSRDNQVDAAVLRNQLRYDIWNDEHCRAGPGIPDL